MGHPELLKLQILRLCLRMTFFPRMAVSRGVELFPLKLKDGLNGPPGRMRQWRGFG